MWGIYSDQEGLVNCYDTKEEAEQALEDEYSDEYGWYVEEIKEIEQ